MQERETEPPRSAAPFLCVFLILLMRYTLHLDSTTIPVGLGAVCHLLCLFSSIFYSHVSIAMTCNLFVPVDSIFDIFSACPR